MRFLQISGRISFASFLVAAAIGLAASLGTRWSYWDYRTGLLAIFPVCLYFAAAAFIAGAGWLVTALVQNRATGLRYGLTGFAGATVLLLIPLSAYVQSYGRPPIHDISTDIEHPPEFEALLDQRDGATNPPEYDGADRVTFQGRVYATSQLQKKYYPEIHTIGQLMPPERLFLRALAAARAMGWTIIAVVPDEGRIEATDTTLFFGLVSDIAIRVKPSGMGARLDIRAKSRVGQADGGRNAGLIRAYVRQLASS
jgi:hypothetical protein